MRTRVEIPVWAFPRFCTWSYSGVFLKASTFAGQERSITLLISPSLIIGKDFEREWYLHPKESCHTCQVVVRVSTCDEVWVIVCSVTTRTPCSHTLVSHTPVICALGPSLSPFKMLWVRYESAVLRLLGYKYLPKLLQSSLLNHSFTAPHFQQSLQKSITSHQVHS